MNLWSLQATLSWHLWFGHGLTVWDDICHWCLCFSLLWLQRHPRPLWSFFLSSRTASNCWWFPWGTLKNQQKQLNQLQCDIHLGHPWIISIHSLWTSETKPVCQVHSKHLWVFWYPTHLPATKQSVCYLDTCAFPSTYLLHRYSKWNLVSLPTQTIVSFHETDVCRVVKTI